MADDFEKRLVDTNALLMGHGVGVAALEAMFNLVNSQSVLSASMVRDHEMSHPIQMQALAQALSQLLACSEAMQCKQAPAVAVDIPPKAPAAPPPVQPVGQDSMELGAVADASALDNFKKAASADPQTSSINMDSITSQSGLDSAQVKELLAQFMDMTGNHMTQVLSNSKPTLEVT